ncbi:MAG: DedA family protein [Shewanella sp.]|uniref:DedA family protein n=1 Tax=Shewanella sp. SNU WT4 TaxID=2590015 RepID=UPI001127BB4F|nr:DedA family protein [Shewanella sp. SNU WT4]QDF68327.1 DedA family protein [Shewanella sp. SNU WT4]
MLDSVGSVLQALWHHDFVALQSPGSALVIYACVATLIFLESAFLPAAPLPCDSVVILSGTLAAVGVLNPLVILLLIFIAAGFGSYLAFVQGRLLNRLPRVQGWVNAVPSNRLQTVDKLLSRHGLIALFCARFIPVVRSLLPLMMGMRMHNSVKFYGFAWLSALLWTALLVGLGYLLPSLPEPVSKVATMILMAAPVITLILAISSWLIIKFRHKWRKG